jgi:predicted kinase
MLIILGGLPGVGKTTLALELARRLGAVHIRIDSIEQAIRESGVTVVSLDDAGYRVGYALAEDNLRLGRIVIADSVNPLPITRDAWLAVADRAEVTAIEIEVVCSDPAEHRRRVEQRLSRRTTLFGGPTWEEVMARDYRAWDRKHVVIDTAGRTIEQAVATLQAQARLHEGLDPGWTPPRSRDELHEK